uniref:Pro-apoptotic WT1 regulator n=1 Tax=Dromaius novaehollandiae TaxID=8790 RepID=A0A8C4J1R3_DRONO
MATGGYRSAAGSTTDFLEEWKAKREKMRAKQAPLVPAAAAGGEAKPLGGTSSAELNNNLHPGGGAGPEPGSGCRRCCCRPPNAPALDVGLVVCLGESCSRGVSFLQHAEKHRGLACKVKYKCSFVTEYFWEDAITQQNTIQNESSSADAAGSYLLQSFFPSRLVPNMSDTPNVPEDDVANRYSRTERTTYSRYSRDANSSGNSVPSNALEKRIEELERELAKERQENVRLMKITQDKEELIVKLKEEIDLLNRDLDDIEDENEQLKQENKTLLKVVGQLTR